MRLGVPDESAHARNSIFHGILWTTLVDGIFTCYDLPVQQKLQVNRKEKAARKYLLLLKLVRSQSREDGMVEH